MKKLKFGILGLLLSLFVFGCSSDSKAPDYIKGKKIEFYFTSADGTYAKLKGYRRYIYFNENGTYEWRTRSGILEDSGTYDYDQDSSDTGEVNMYSDYGKNSGNELKIMMHFNSSRSGRFQGKLEQGDAAGMVGGRFKFRKKT